MTQEQIEKIREIIREEMSGRLGYVFSKNIEIMDERNIQVGNSKGTQIGTEITQKIGFLGQTPISRQATISDPATQGASYVQADVQSIVTAVNTIIDRLQAFGFIA